MDCGLYAKYTTQVEVPKGDTSGRIKLFNQLSGDEATAEKMKPRHGLDRWSRVDSPVKNGTIFHYLHPGRYLHGRNTPQRNPVRVPLGVSTGLALPPFHV